MRWMLVLLAACNGDLLAPPEPAPIEHTLTRTAIADTPSLGEPPVVVAAVTGPTGATSNLPTTPATPSTPTPSPVTPPPVSPPACPSGALLCEDFESGIDPTRWKTNGAAFTIDEAITTPDGKSSVHMAYGAPYGHLGQQTLELRPKLAAPDDRMYVRLYMRFGDLRLPGAHPSFVSVTDDTNMVGFGSISNDFTMMGWGFYNGGLDNARAWYEGGHWHPGAEDGDTTPQSEQNLAAQEWICVELMYFGDHQGPTDTAHPNEQVTIWVNGTERPEMNLSDALWKADLGGNPPEHWSPRYDGATWRFGLDSFGPNNAALDIWFDAIVFSHTRIGCL